MSALSDLPVCGRVWDIFPQSPLSPRTEQAGANGAPICRISLCGGTGNRRKRAQDTSRHSQHFKKGRRVLLFGPFYAGSRARRQSRGAAARAGARAAGPGTGGRAGARAAKAEGAGGKGRGAAARAGARRQNRSAGGNRMYSGVDRGAAALGTQPESGPGFPGPLLPNGRTPYPFRATITSLYIDWSTRCASSSHGPPSIT